MKQRILVKKLKQAGFRFYRHGGNHDIYICGQQQEQIPRHKEINEALAQPFLINGVYHNLEEESY